MLIKIESCGECPCAKRVGEGREMDSYFCEAKSFEVIAKHVDRRSDPQGIPSWCPLREMEVSE